MIGPAIQAQARQYSSGEGNPMKRATRILVANTPKLMREVVVATLADQPDIEMVGEVSEEAEILPRVQATLPDLVVIALDETESRPLICDRVLREYPGVRVIAVASRRDRTICYWASFDIHSNDIEASPAGILSAVRNTSALGRNLL
jgi:chemotaxis response regulator CheB